jgi:osmotically inducible lipoprotein OsmB
MKSIRVMALSAVASLGVLALAACGDTMEQRAASGALIGAGAGAVATGEASGAVVGGVAGAAVGALTTERRCVRRDRDGDCTRWEDDD